MAYSYHCAAGFAGQHLTPSMRLALQFLQHQGGHRSFGRSAYALYVPYWPSFHFFFCFCCCCWDAFGALAIRTIRIAHFLGCVRFGRVIKTRNLLLGKSLNFICQQRQKHCHVVVRNYSNSLVLTPIQTHTETHSNTLLAVWRPLSLAATVNDV